MKTAIRSHISFKKEVLLSFQMKNSYLIGDHNNHFKAIHCHFPCAYVVEGIEGSLLRTVEESNRGSGRCIYPLDIMIPQFLAIERISSLCFEQPLLLDIIDRKKGALISHAEWSINYRVRL